MDEYDTTDEDAHTYDFDVVEQYSIKATPHHDVHSPHTHVVPGHQDLEKTYRTIMEHHPHGPIHHDTPHTVEF